MVFAVHYVVAPVMLGLLALAARTIWEETREPADHLAPGGG